MLKIGEQKGYSFLCVRNRKMQSTLQSLYNFFLPDRSAYKKTNSKEIEYEIIALSFVFCTLFSYRINSVDQPKKAVTSSKASPKLEFTPPFLNQFTISFFNFFFPTHSIHYYRPRWSQLCTRRLVDSQKCSVSIIRGLYHGFTSGKIESSKIRLRTVSKRKRRRNEKLETSVG